METIEAASELFDYGERSAAAKAGIFEVEVMKLNLL